jgi:hypothetical protein
MNKLFASLLVLSCIQLAGCKEKEAEVPATTPTVAQPPEPLVTPVPTVATAVAAPPQANTAPAAMPTGELPDPFESRKVSADGSPNKSDLEALQAVVDAYAFGPDGLGAPRINSLDDLVAKKYLRKIPSAPKGMKWAYDSAKWKVSLVPQ